jgi:hypothetical protein
MLNSSIYKTLNELSELLSQLSNEDFSKPCPALSNSSIGEHTRHVIEMFQCLEKQYDLGVVNYDKRKRDQYIQTDTLFAKQSIDLILNQLDKPNKFIQLQQFIDGEEILIESNYHRELLYNLEHCIHHQALIKVAILQLENILVNDNFGVACSTIEFRKQCAQ